MYTHYDKLKTIKTVLGSSRRTKKRAFLLVCPRAGWLLAENSHWLFFKALAPDKLKTIKTKCLLSRKQCFVKYALYDKLKTIKTVYISKL
jgi:hypothetical protein